MCHPVVHNPRKPRVSVPQASIRKTELSNCIQMRMLKHIRLSPELRYRVNIRKGELRQLEVNFRQRPLVQMCLQVPGCWREEWQSDCIPHRINVLEVGTGPPQAEMLQHSFLHPSSRRKIKNTEVKC